MCFPLGVHVRVRVCVFMCVYAYASVGVSMCALYVRVCVMNVAHTCVRSYISVRGSPSTNTIIDEHVCVCVCVCIANHEVFVVHAN